MLVASNRRIFRCAHSGATGANSGAWKVPTAFRRMRPNSRSFKKISFADRFGVSRRTQSVDGFHCRPYTGNSPLLCPNSSKNSEIHVLDHEPLALPCKLMYLFMSEP